MTQSGSDPDLIRHPVAGFWLWAFPLALILVSVLLDGWNGDDSAKSFGWPLSLTVMGIACLVNARRCGRLHCYFTGPFFLFMAILSLAYAQHWLIELSRGWSVLSIALLLGSVLLYLIPERLFGRYRDGRARAD